LDRQDETGVEPRVVRDAEAADQAEHPTLKTAARITELDISALGQLFMESTAGSNRASKARPYRGDLEAAFC
jgi:hypothetical protein